MNTNIKRGIVTGAISLSLLGGTAAGVVAQNQGNSGNQGGAAGLIAAVVQLNNTDIDVITVDDSFNNLTVRALNNSPILNDLKIDVDDVNVLSGVTIFVLSNGDSIVLQ